MRPPGAICFNLIYFVFGCDSNEWSTQLAGWAQWAAGVFVHGMPDCAHITISNNLNKISKNLPFLETSNGYTFGECSDGPAKVRSRYRPKACHNGDYRFRLRNFGRCKSDSRCGSNSGHSFNPTSIVKQPIDFSSLFQDCLVNPDAANVSSKLSSISGLSGFWLAPAPAPARLTRYNLHYYS